MKHDIASNVKEINLIKNDITELYLNKMFLKNVYNILFYNEKTQIDLRNDKYFYERVFEDNYSINDFIELWISKLVWKQIVFH